MPQFFMNDSDAPEFLELDEFTRGYIEAMFWTETAPGVSIEEFETAEYQAEMVEGRTDGSIPGEAGFSDLDPEFLADIIRDCADFQKENEEDLTEAYDNGRINGYDAANAGHDYWLTRNGHGVGFWDRDLGDVGDRLSAACRNQTVDIFWQDGKVIG